MDNWRPVGQDESLGQDGSVWQDGLIGKDGTVGQDGLDGEHRSSWLPSLVADLLPPCTAT